MIKASITYYKKGSFNKIHLNFTKKEFEKVKKDVVKTNYDGSLVLKNGDIVEIHK